MMEPVSGYGMMRGRDVEKGYKKSDHGNTADAAGADTVHRPGRSRLRPQSLMGGIHGDRDLRKNADEPRKSRQCHKDHDADSDLRRPAVREDPSDRRGVVTSARTRNPWADPRVFLEEGEIQTVETLIKCIVIALRQRRVGGNGWSLSEAMRDFVRVDE